MASALRQDTVIPENFFKTRERNFIQNPIWFFFGEKMNSESGFPPPKLKTVGPKIIGFPHAQTVDLEMAIIRKR